MQYIYLCFQIGFLIYKNFAKEDSNLMEKIIGEIEYESLLDSFYDNAHLKHINFVVEKENHMKEMVGINTFHESTLDKYRSMVDYQSTLERRKKLDLRVKAAFESFDDNKDGKVTTEEFEKKFKSLDVPLEKIKDFLGKIKKNNDKEGSLKLESVIKKYVDLMLKNDLDEDRPVRFSYDILESPFYKQQFGYESQHDLNVKKEYDESLLSHLKDGMKVATGLKDIK